MATPSWSEATVIAAQVLARGDPLRGTLNLTNKFGAWVYINLGRGGATVIGTAIAIRVRNVAKQSGGAKSAGGGHPGPVASLASSTALADCNTTVNAESASGQRVLNVANIGSAAAGDIICVQDSGGGVTRLEWGRVSKTAAGVLTLDDDLQYTHTAAQADTVRNEADSFAPIWLQGGALIEVVIDYGAAATGDSITVQALAQVCDSVA